MIPRFSVVVPTCGRPDLLTQALASVAAQTEPDFECIIVDDGSGSARAVMPTDPRFRLIELDRNQGVAAARNCGTAAARGSHLAFLDDDDLWTPRRLERAGHGLDRSPIAVCRSAWADDPLTSGDPPLEGDVHDRVLDRFTPSLGRTAIWRSAMVPFDERYPASEDVEWWLRVSEGREVAFDPEIGQLVRRHDGMRTSHGEAARILGSILLLDQHATYFARHRRARAFRQYRIGYLHLALGDRRQAVKWLARSLASRPSVRATNALRRSLQRRA